jgi:outer membrane immunogenic protein
MKRLVLASIGALALVSTVGAANAADLPRREAMPTKAPIYAPIYNWTGAYVGINGGGGWGRSDTSAPFASGSFNTSGAVLGGTLGYNYQVGQTVFGLEGDVDWSNVRGSTTCGAGFSCETKNSWLATARGRVGYAFDRVMPYVTGGLAVGDIKSSVAGIGSSTQTKAGWTLGGGVEAAIAGPWTAKVEYLYADLGRGSSMLGSDTKFNTSLVRAGVNYRF